MDQAAVWKIWGPLLTIAIVFAIRLRRVRQERPFDPARWWLLPLFFAGIVGLLLASAPPPLAGWLAFLLGIAPGAMFGWQRGKLTNLHLCEGGQVMQRTSPLAVLMLLGIVAIRMTVRQLWGGELGDPHPPLAATLVTDGLLGFALGLVVATRVELTLRARALLAGRRSAG